MSFGRYLFIYSVVSVNRNIVRYNKYLVVVTVVVVLSVIVIVIVISLEHSTVVVGVFKFKFEYPICSVFREKSLIVLGLFHYKYCSEYLLCGPASVGADGSWITEFPYTVGWALYRWTTTCARRSRWALVIWCSSSTRRRCASTPAVTSSTPDPTDYRSLCVRSALTAKRI